MASTRAALLLVALFKVQGQTEPVPTADPSRTIATSATSSVVLDVFSDSACSTFAYTLSAWERRCSALGSRAGAAAFFSVAQQSCQNPAGQAPTAALRIFRTAEATTAQCSGAAFFDVPVTFSGGSTPCRPLGGDLPFFFRTRAINCQLAEAGTLFTLRRYGSQGCAGAPTAADVLHTGNCTWNGYQGALNATFITSQTSASKYNLVAWAASPSGCAGDPSTAAAATVLLALPPEAESGDATTGCTAATTGGGFFTLRQASLYTPPGAGRLPDQPLGGLEVAAIIIATLVLILLGYYLLVRNNLLCKAAPVQKQGTRPRPDVTAARVPSSVKNPVEQRSGPAVVVVPNALSASGAGIKEFK